MYPRRGMLVVCWNCISEKVKLCKVKRWSDKMRWMRQKTLWKRNAKKMYANHTTLSEILRTILFLSWSTTKSTNWCTGNVWLILTPLKHIHLPCWLIRENFTNAYFFLFMMCRTLHTSEEYTSRLTLKKFFGIKMVWFKNLLFCLLSPIQITPCPTYEILWRDILSHDSWWLIFNSSRK